MDRLGFCAAQIAAGQRGRGRFVESRIFHGAKSAVLYYNLACYACLQGFHEEAEKHLTKACKMDERFEGQSLSEPDLQGMMPF